MHLACGCCCHQHLKRVSHMHAMQRYLRKHAQLTLLYMHTHTHMQHLISAFQQDAVHQQRFEKFLKQQNLQHRLQVLSSRARGCVCLCTCMFICAPVSISSSESCMFQRRQILQLERGGVDAVVPGQHDGRVVYACVVMLSHCQVARRATRNDSSPNACRHTRCVA